MTLAHDGNVKFYVCPTITNIAAPTVAQVVTAGTLLAGITNYSLSFSEGSVDVAGVDDLHDATRAGTTSGSIEITFKDDASTVAANRTVMPFRGNAFLVRTKDGPFTATKKVEVYPVQFGQARPEGYGRNAVQKFSITCNVTGNYDLNATATA
jgi:hypothetical protein